ncbi:hypothetical protein PM035_06760 [Halorubrum ezzemoulense]|uniref:hypothetical protein n=1 Tax=Halorubrum ezzemoulense TaxID=337243 RepID=UPI00232D5741|nr:hypothetical protein [Halorubrum ezzemoulense]MDB2260202.1 hypothetical protein [Halorubrum ezzemoulense]MDB2267405.1 hypothetical protein [Halorubrum ezzemoulense]
MSDDEPTGRPSLEAVTEWDGGVSWVAHPEEDAMRGSHALTTEGGVWVVDPLDADGLDDRLSDLGEVAGVVVTHDRHTRDAEAIAARHGVAVSVPEWMDLTREKLDGEPEPFDAELPGTNYEAHRLIDTDEWEEAVLVDESGGTLVVMETLGTLPGFCEGDNDVGVHPALDEAPEGLADYRPERILVGHGESVSEGGATKLAAALDAD